MPFQPIPTVHSSPSVTLPEAFRQRVFALQREADWDGEGAEPITGETCGAALGFVEAALALDTDLPLPFPAPSASGAVSLQWENEVQDLVIRVFNPDQVESYFEQANGRYVSLVESPEAAIRRLLVFKPRQT